MEAATPPRELTGEKARRIVDAMRAPVAQRGVAGSTFDQVAREAGVSRGLLHYYSGTKERLLAEVVRRDSGIRMARPDAALAPAKRDEGVVALRAEPDAVATTLTAAADGLALRMLAEPEGDFTQALDAAVACARGLLCEP
ncbi:MAG: transcriptional regulator, TetR family [uncultured Solirubrobacteraceae bacterium]|uniref:Transcriptional regulator, TetR family n=1 Tax=uncultured Solirubrobacteraceae bacterium TaxID=1162706 RepID=A0A6J4S0C0_9ACTN|nr:MAG: transcriptional regulator, TetR family [uncultured Solirubrobacteraceae bacterium]